MDPRKDIIKTGKILEQKGLTRAACGNISLRLGKNKFLITSSGKVKGALKTSDILAINEKGVVSSGKGKPSTETLMHLMVYKLRPDVNAVIHAHPPYAVALTLLDDDLSLDILPEITLTLGKIPVTRYATPCTGEDAEVIKEFIDKYDAMMLPRHGSVTVGKNLNEALIKLEQLEYTAKVISIAKMIGNVTALSEEQMKELLIVKESLI